MTGTDVPNRIAAGAPTGTTAQPCRAEHGRCARLLGSPGLDRGPLPGSRGSLRPLSLSPSRSSRSRRAPSRAQSCADSRRAGRCCGCCQLRFTDQPQRWAVAPAVFMGVGGLVLVTFGSPAREALGWVWPPTLLLLVIWMLRQTRRHMRSRSGRVQLYLVFAILAISAVGGGYATVLEATDSTAMPATGRLIDVGGHKLYLNCVGSGSPTVVLEPGAGATSSQLGWIAPAVAAQYPRVRVRPCRSWLERDRRQPPGRRADSHRSAHLAAPRRRRRAVRPGGALVRRPVRPHLRRALPRRGCGPGAPRLHCVEGTREVRHSVFRQFRGTGRPSSRPDVSLGSRRLDLACWGSWISGLFPRNPETRRGPAWRRRAGSAVPSTSTCVAALRRRKLLHFATSPTSRCSS